MAGGSTMSAHRDSQTCVILAGGLGTRLREVIDDLPKCLAPVGNRTFLQVQLDCLARVGVTDVVLSLGYGADSVISALECSPLPLPIRYAVEPKPLGTGGAISYILDTFGMDEALVTNGDTYLDGDLSQMLAPLNRKCNEQFRMAGVMVSDRFRFGGVQANEAGRVTGFIEKGHSGAGPINAGLYRLCRAALPENRSGACSLEKEILPSLVERGSVTLIMVGGAFMDIGVPEDYKRFCEDRGA